MPPRLLLPTLLLAAASSLPAAVVGTNPPALSLTAERIAALPEGERPAWQDYLARSERQHEADQAFVAAELKTAGLAQPVMPPEGFGRGTMPLDRPAAWYATAFALQTADSIVSYQMPNGGWGKNLAMHDHVRKPGESFITDNISRYLAPGDFDTPRDRYWNYFGTLDNDCTTTQLRFLAHVITAVGTSGRGAAYEAAFLRGLDYLFHAQYPNGGWPQVWPLEGGYHDAITFNDNAVNQAVEVLQGAALGQAPYAFVPAEIRPRAAAAAAQGIACILACQIRVDGKLTVWCQQHDPLTLAPTSARNFEPPALCSEESGHVVEFLMTVPNPSPEVVASVHAAAVWFKQAAIYGQVWQRSRGGRRPGGGGAAGPAPAPANSAPAVITRLVPTPGAGPIWARYYDAATRRPVFGDRDKTIHDQVTDLSAERQRGYQWYGSEPREMLDAYASWSAAHPAGS